MSSDSPIANTGPHPMTPTPQAVKLYKDWLRDARNDLSSAAIPNELPWHSRCAIAELTDLAIELVKGETECEVRLFTGSVTEGVYDAEWSGNIQKFLDCGGKLRILVWDKDLSPETKLRLVNILQHKNCDVRFSGTRAMGEKLNHFYVVGDRSFRREAPHPHYDADMFSATSPEIPAQICFNDRDEAEELIKRFDSVWSACA